MAPLILLLLSLTPAFAGPVVGPVGEVRVSPPMNAAVFSAVHSFVNSGAGMKLMTTMPGLRALAALDASRPGALQALGPLAARLPVTFTATAVSPQLVHAFAQAYEKAADDAAVEFDARARQALDAARADPASAVKIAESFAGYAVYGPALAGRVETFQAVARALQAGQNADELARRLFQDKPAPGPADSAAVAAAPGSQHRTGLRKSQPGESFARAEPSVPAVRPLRAAVIGATALAIPVVAATHATGFFAQHFAAGFWPLVESIKAVFFGTAGILNLPALPILFSVGVPLALAAVILGLIAVKIDPVSMRKRITPLSAVPWKHRIASLWVTIGVMPTLEEGMFRGGTFLAGFLLLVPFLGPVGATAVAAFVDGIYFASIHTYGPLWPRVFLAAAATAGFLLTGSLWTAALIHALNNLIALMVPQRLYTPAETTAQTLRRILRDPSAPGAQAVRDALNAGQTTIRAKMTFVERGDVMHMSGVEPYDKMAWESGVFTLRLDHPLGDPTPEVTWQGGEELIKVRRNEVLAYYGLRPARFLDRLRTVFYRPD